MKSMLLILAILLMIVGCKSLETKRVIIPNKIITTN